jgi:hypothetical protein
MQIKGIEGLSTQEINDELKAGARFVVFGYCISLVVITFRRNSDVYFIRAGESAAKKGWRYTGLSILLGWWGIPWGPIYTIGSLSTNFGGGKDVTQQILSTINAR